MDTKFDAEQEMKDMFDVQYQSSTEAHTNQQATSEQHTNEQAAIESKADEEGVSEPKTEEAPPEATSGQGLPHAKKKKRDISPVAIYARTIAYDKDYAVIQRDENVALCRWTGSYWNQLSRFEASRDAYIWLVNFAPDMASSSAAGEAYRTALLQTKPLPQTHGKTVIPLQNVWIHVDDDGSFTVRAPRRNLPITYQIDVVLIADFGPYTPRPVPKDSRFQKFLDSSLPDKEVQNLVQEYSGYTLLNDTRFQKAICNLGVGSNGKSILSNIMCRLHKKVAAIRIDRMQGFGLSPLLNASLALSAETPKNKIDEQLLKACISSDPISMEFKGQNEFTYRPTAKFWLNMNSFPKISDESDGIWRRLLLVEWKAKFEGKDKIKNLDQLIIDNEMDYVLDWCLAGLQRLLKRGDFDVPNSVQHSATREREASNTVGQFCDVYFVAESAECGLLKENFYAHYRDFCNNQQFMPLGNVEFWKRIKLSYPNLTEKKMTVPGRLGALTTRKRFINLAFTGSAQATE